MYNFGTFFLWALAACLLWHASLAKDRQSGRIFLLQELEQGNLRDSDNVVKAKLDRLEAKIGELQAKQEEQLQEVKTQLQRVEAKLEGQLLAIQTKVEEYQAKLEIQTGLKNKPQEVLSKMEKPNQLEGVPKKMEESQQDSDSDGNTIPPPGFKKIRNRYLQLIHLSSAARKYRFINGSPDQEKAIIRCKELGSEQVRNVSVEEQFILLGNLMEECREVLYGMGIWKDYCNNRVYTVCEWDANLK